MYRKEQRAKKGTHELIQRYKSGSEDGAANGMQGDISKKGSCMWPWHLYLCMEILHCLPE